MWQIHELPMEGGMMFQSLALKGPLSQRNGRGRHECPFMCGVLVREMGRGVAHFTKYDARESDSSIGHVFREIGRFAF